MNTENLVPLLIAFTLIVCVATFSSCTYVTTKDHNSCVANSKSAEIAGLCKSAR